MLPPAAWALAIALMWSVPSITQKLLLQRFPLHFLMSMSALFYALFVVVFLRHQWSAGGADELRLVGKHAPWLGLALASAFFGGFVPNYVFGKLLERHPAYWVTALAYCSPLFTTVAAALWLRERPTVRHVLGVALVVGGVACLSACPTD